MRDNKHLALFMVTQSLLRRAWCARCFKQGCTTSRGASLQQHGHDLISDEPARLLHLLPHPCAHA